LGLWRNW